MYHTQNDSFTFFLSLKEGGSLTQPLPHDRGSCADNPEARHVVVTWNRRPELSESFPEGSAKFFVRLMRLDPCRPRRQL